MRTILVAERCYDCADPIPEGGIRRRNVAVGTTWVSGSGRPGDYGRNATQWGRVSLCRRCDRRRDDAEWAEQVTVALVFGVLIVIAAVAYVVTQTPPPKPIPVAVPEAPAINVKKRPVADERRRDEPRRDAKQQAENEDAASPDEPRADEPRPDEPPRTPSSPAKGIAARTGVLELRSPEPLTADVTQWVEIDGGERRDWATGSRAVRVELPPGDHRVVVRAIHHRREVVVFDESIAVVPNATQRVAVGY